MNFTDSTDTTLLDDALKNYIKGVDIDARTKDLRFEIILMPEDLNSGHVTPPEIVRAFTRLRSQAGVAPGQLSIKVDDDALVIRGMTLDWKRLKDLAEGKKQTSMQR